MEPKASEKRLWVLARLYHYFSYFLDRVSLVRSEAARYSKPRRQATQGYKPWTQAFKYYKGVPKLPPTSGFGIPPGTHFRSENQHLKTHENSGKITQKVGPGGQNDPKWLPKWSKNGAKLCTLCTFVVLCKTTPLCSGIAVYSVPKPPKLAR